jgi:hypothetical protein
MRSGTSSTTTTLLVSDMCLPVEHFADSQTTLLVSIQCLDNFDPRLTTLKDVLGQVPLMTLQTKKKM